ncbi:flagellar basal body rod protein FlgB [Falsiruegeria litorea R37]|uniref:Flagellar basal body rod protein FlgB n=1 Tax=Falsiruegeria litorea R37 TaxID=1200284 RepID=A0A1Y5TGZ1_9RHOB|nr:FlgB family protein [Falsiruegeria litorea]SLN63803.1 flagellar basal body rod protein FlgB [Falsiruegeria litorea R37]
MFSDLNVFKMAYAMATHAGKRQAIVSQNMANADTPGYQARDIESFSNAYVKNGARIEMQASRAGHLNGVERGAPDWAVFHPDLPKDPNQNNVAIEEEMLKAVEVKRQHDRAIAIYRSSMSVLRGTLGRS